MWQRKQTIFLFLAAVCLVVSIFLPEQNIYLIGASALAAVVSLADIFLYKNRKLQMKVCRIAQLFLLVWCALCAWIIISADNWEAGNMTFRIGVVLVLLSGLMLNLAYKGIKHDDDLVRSADRLR
jgi:hypothetical protein